MSVENLKVGCFALVDPFSSLEHQLKRIEEMGFKYADITDTHQGALLGGGLFDAAVSLDDNPFHVKRLFDKYNLTISSVASHAHLLDPPSPARFGTAEIMKSIKLAHALGIKCVITTEHAGTTEWAKNLTYDQKVFTTTEKLVEPLKLAEDMGIQLLLEPHGPLTDSVQGMKDLLTASDSSALGVCLDTGNSWLGGADPVEMAKEFKDLIGHVHWKDLPTEMEEVRGNQFGCGFSSIALGEGVIDLEGVYEVIHDAPIPHCTLEITGEQNLKKSDEFLNSMRQKYQEK